jgi:hypothetical protein
MREAEHVKMRVRLPSELVPLTDFDSVGEDVHHKISNRYHEYVSIASMTYLGKWRRERGGNATRGGLRRWNGGPNTRQCRLSARRRDRCLAACEFRIIQVATLQSGKCITECSTRRLVALRRTSDNASLLKLDGKQPLNIFSPKKLRNVVMMEG